MLNLVVRRETARLLKVKAQRNEMGFEYVRVFSGFRAGTNGGLIKSWQWTGGFIKGADVLACCGCIIHSFLTTTLLGLISYRS
jgi:hypothetical protein